MKKMIVIIKKSGYAELNFEYLVDVPDRKITQFLNDCKQHPIDTIRKYPHQIVKDYRDYIERMETQSCEVDPSIQLQPCNTIDTRRLIRYSLTASHRSEAIGSHLWKASESLTKKDFKAMLKNIEKEIAILESQRACKGVN